MCMQGGFPYAKMLTKAAVLLSVSAVALLKVSGYREGS